MQILTRTSRPRQAEIEELRRRCPIADVWSALGGPPFRGKRGAAWWRGGKNLSVSVEIERGLWHDFMDGHGGDVLGLVQQVLGCDFPAAVRWLADFAGISVTTSGANHQGSADPSWHADLRYAGWFAIAARMMAEQVLEESVFWDPIRPVMTQLLRTLRLGDAAVVAEYRDRRAREPQFTAGLVEAGRRSEERLYDRIAIFIVQELVDGEAQCGEDTGTCDEDPRGESAA